MIYASVEAVSHCDFSLNCVCVYIKSFIFIKIVFFFAGGKKKKRVYGEIDFFD